jgi:hypothetical protein
VDQDLELLQRCLSGENSAWEGLLRVYTRKIYNLCYRFTGRAEEAEDLTQEVFIKVFQTLQTFDAAQGSFSTWLHRVARNHLVDHYRKGPAPGQDPPATWKPGNGKSNSNGVWTAFRRICGRRWCCGTCTTWTTWKSPRSWGFPRGRLNPE